jgi:hypothetical protein
MYHKDAKTMKQENEINDDLIDRGSYYEIRDYTTRLEYDEDGEIAAVIHCLYIPKFIVERD